MIGDACLHRGRDADAGMNPAEIAEREERRECCPVVLPLPAEGVG